MSGITPSRGSRLVLGGEALAAGPTWLARAWAGSLRKVLGRLDKGLITGAIFATLPDGSTMTLGHRAPGFEATVTIHDWRALLRLVTAGSIGWYQAWERGEWSSPDPVPLFALFMANADSLGGAARAHGPWRWVARVLHAMHRNSRSGSERNIHAHYDLGNDFYSTWLDPEMVYSSARFDAGATTLEAAQLRKLQTIADRVAGAQTVLEIGCGWGALAQALHDRGSTVTAISLSDEQLAWARERRSAGIAFRHQDYRDVTEQFDAIVSVEMVEAVGREYWPDFFACLASRLKTGGRAAIQYIAMREELFDDYARSADFIQAYIFPGGLLVRESEFRALADKHGLEWSDAVSFPIDYAETLRLWRERFDRAVAEGRLPDGFDQRFVNLWRYYLMYCEGGFRGRGIDVAQVTLQKR